MKENSTEERSLGRRSILGAAAVALSAGALAFGKKQEIELGEPNRSASNPGPVNRALAGENPGSEMPPASNKGDVIPVWYSFDLAHRRVQDGGWTRQVTQESCPPQRTWRA